MVSRVQHSKVTQPAGYAPSGECGWGFLETAREAHHGQSVQGLAVDLHDWGWSVGELTATSVRAAGGVRIWVKGWKSGAV